MRIKELFTVPEGTKVTEKMFGRVLISSICSILLCMVCLTATSWAWFTASVESTVNIQIAPVTLKTEVTLGTETKDPLGNGSYSLEPGQYKLKLTLEREDPKYTAYVLVSFHHTQMQDYFLAFSPEAGKTQTVTVTVAETAATVNFRVTWISPDGANAVLDGGAITVGQPETTDVTTQPTEGTTAPTQETHPAETTEPTEPEESTEPSTGETVPESQDPAPSEDPQEQSQETQPAEPPASME